MEKALLIVVALLIFVPFIMCTVTLNVTEKTLKAGDEKIRKLADRLDECEQSLATIYDEIGELKDSYEYLLDYHDDEF